MPSCRGWGRGGDEVEVKGYKLAIFQGDGKRRLESIREAFVDVAHRSIIIANERKKTSSSMSRIDTTSRTISSTLFTVVLASSLLIKRGECSPFPTDELPP